VASAVLWFRRDLRLDDLPALAAAATVGSRGVVPLFVVEASLLAAAGPNRRRFLAESLRALDRELGDTLVLRHGDPRRVVPAVAAEVGARVVVATGDFGPYGAARDQSVAEALCVAGRSLLTIDSPYVVAPGTVRGSSGAPLRVWPSALPRRVEASRYAREHYRAPCLRAGG
jgi:deoxyribodipyrimidine photo-lyase